MESLVESSNVCLSDSIGEEGNKDAPNSIEERQADDVGYHWVMIPE